MYITEIKRNIIIDTDAGGDPDDTLAIIQACQLDNVIAFVTSDETPDGARARFVKQLVNEAGSDIPVFTGLPSPNPGKHLLGKLVGGLSVQPPIMTVSMGALLAHPETIHWVGIGSFTNLAWVGRNYHAYDMRVTAMGGRLSSDPVVRPEHNVKVDPEAAVSVVDMFNDITFVPSTVTMSELMAVSHDHEALKILKARGALSALNNFEVWFRDKFDKSYQHDLETLAFACGAASGAVKSVTMNREGRFNDGKGSNINVVYGDFEYDKVWEWFYATQSKGYDTN